MIPEFIQCLNCRIGTLRRGKATYAQWLDDQLVLVPNVSAWQCDVCGDFAYDEERRSRVRFSQNVQDQMRAAGRFLRRIDVRRKAIPKRELVVALNIE